jgi:ribosomal protein S18 acetylase RimI-like enzyme
LDDVAALIESNVSEFLLSMGTAGGGVERADEEITWTVGGSPIDYHNAVVRCHASEARAAGLVEEWRAELRTRSLPGSWHLTPTMQPSTLASLLAAAGFDDGGEEPAMAASLSDLVAAPASGDLKVTRVDSANQLDDYRGVLASGFGEGPKEADWVASIYATTGLAANGPWRHFVGRVRSEPVATASLLLTDATGGIYFVCTKPELRRRGYGAALTHRTMVEAAASGAKYAVLGSSPMGQRVYERLGFRTVFSYRLFEIGSSPTDRS